MESPAGCMESVAKRRHGITRQRVFLLRIDYIQHFVLIPYRRQAADFIHAYRRDYIESYAEVLDFGGLFVLLGLKRNPRSTLHLFPRPFGLELATFVVELFEVLCYNIFERREMQ